jgi:hypothetical protein
MMDPLVGNVHTMEPEEASRAYRLLLADLRRVPSITAQVETRQRHEHASSLPE